MLYIERMMTLLEIINLSKSFKGKQVVNSVNLYLERGEIVGLLCNRMVQVNLQQYL